MVSTSARKQAPSIAALHYGAIMLALSSVAYKPKMISGLWAAMPKFKLWLICAGYPLFIAQWSGDLGPPAPSRKTGPLSFKLFFPCCDAICDSTAGARQFERITS